MVGALVGGFGTSIVELIVAALAAIRHSPQLALGSLIGSVIANVCLALALAALIAPMEVDSATVRREAPLSVVSVVLFGCLAAIGLSVVTGLVMAVVLVPVIILLLASTRRGGSDELAVEVLEYLETPRFQARREVLRTIAALALMLGGAELLVRSSVGLADRIGLSQGFAGLTLVGVGTSAPLIASSIQGVRRGEHDLVVGNVLGGNLFIALAGGALVGLLSPVTVDGSGLISVSLMIGVVVGSWLAMSKGRVIGRTAALTLLVSYAVILPFSNR